LTKGLEEEVYTGTADGTVVGLSDRVKEALDGYHTEPDNRNTEFATLPHRSYPALCGEFMWFRRTLREYIAGLGPYTLIPGATLSLGDSSVFHLSDPDNQYYRFIRDTYGANVVTASAHISIGIEDPETLLRAVRVVRCEAALYLAASACSPFLDGEPTGYHSVRWHRFPHTPEHVPLFASHAEYADWMRRQIAEGTMQNSRHLWVAARPNGHSAPHDLNRLELRICDRIADPELVWGLTALLEARVLEVLGDPTLDPLIRTRRTGDELAASARHNQAEAARLSLDAELVRWTDGTRIPARKWLAEAAEAARPIAAAEGFDAYLDGLADVLEHGSIARRWMDQHRAGTPVASIIRAAIEQAEADDAAYKCR
jgi:predicted glutamate--cysteine ligase